jgi:hypothetical protein
VWTVHQVSAHRARGWLRVNNGSMRRRGSGRRIDVSFQDLTTARAEDVERLARALGILVVEPHYDRCRRIIRWYKRNPQPSRKR